VPPPTSRRTFLFGREHNDSDAWLRFVARLRRSAQGTVAFLAPNRARLTPVRLEDVLHARALCAEHGVCMALQGVPLPETDQPRAVLWVEPGVAWGTVIPLGSSGLWRVDAGCPWAVMQAAGLVRESQRIAGANSMAQWLALTGGDVPFGAIATQIGLVSVDVLFADGTIEVLGAFGDRDSQPLRSLIAQKTIPRLFELGLDPLVSAQREQGVWPYRFRLDSLWSASGANLGCLMAGHGAALGWVVAATWRTGQPAPEGLAPERTELPSRAGSIDHQIKRIMDPLDLFMPVPEQKR
jgi:hypothetical protein